MEKSVILERVYVVPLKRAWNSAYHKRTRKAVRMLKEFASRHMKSEVVLIDRDLNNYIWRKGNANPPRKIKVKMIKYDSGEVIIKKYEEKKITKKEEKEMKEKGEETIKQKESVSEQDQQQEKKKESVKKQEEKTQKKSKSSTSSKK